MLNQLKEDLKLANDKVDEALDERKKLVKEIKQHEVLEKLFEESKEMGAHCNAILNGLMAGGLERRTATNVMLLTLDKNISR